MAYANVSNNLITNGSFEQANNGWTLGGGQVARHYNNAAQGRSSLGPSSMPLGGWSGNDGQWISQSMPTVTHKAYTLSFDAGVTAGYGIQQQCSCRMGASGPAVVVFVVAVQPTMQMLRYSHRPTC